MEGTLQSWKRLDGFTLKMIAIITMTIDHTAAVLTCGDWYWLMRGIGRISFPIYCFLLVEGYFHTKSVGRYALRLLIAAAVSELPFDLAIGGHFPDWDDQSVMLTLLIGLVTVYLVDRSKKWAEKLCATKATQRILWGAMAVVFSCGGVALAERLSSDYGGRGILVILLFYFLREKPVLLTAALLVYLYREFWWLEAIGTLAMIPISMYNGKRGPMPGGKVGQWFFYLYYPLHLGVLVLIAMAIYGTGYFTFG
jgi:hypothetical protein